MTSLHRRVALAVAVAFGVLAAGQPIHAEPIGPAGTTSTSVDPSSLTAPAAAQPVTMDCAEGQVDVNATDPELFTSLPTPDGQTLDHPVRKRIVEGQPYLQPRDLLAVAGITVDHLQLWASESLTCAEPATLPPPAPDVCVDGQADVNDAADHGRLARLYGGPTADRIVSGAPYPTVLNALRIAGVGPGNIKQTSDQVCATPYPVRHAGTDWAFATPGTGIAVSTPGEFGTYTLTVPAGVTEGTGAWASLTEADPALTGALNIDHFDLDVPAVDPHIHGDWDGAVAVTLPADPTDVGPGYAHTVVHHSTVNGLELHANDAVAEAADGRLTVAATDLSLFESLKLSVTWVAGIQGRAVDLAAQAEQIWRSSVGVGGPPVTCDPDLTGQTLPDAELFTVEGEMLADRPLTPPLTHCVTRAHGAEEVPDGRFGVNRGFVNVLDAHPGVAIHNLSASGPLLWSIIGNYYNEWAVSGERPLYLAPGTTFSAHPTGYAGSFHIDTDLIDHLLATTVYWLFQELSALVPNGVAGMVFDILAQHPDCAYQIGTAIGGAVNGDSDGLTAAFGAMTTLFTCIGNSIKATGYGDQPAELLKWVMPDPTVGNAQTAYVFLDRLKRANTMLKAAKYATVLADTFATAGLNGTVELSWKPPAPPSPATDSEGRPIVEGCVRKDFSYATGWTVTVDETCQDLAYGEYPSEPEPPIGDDQPPVNAFDDWIGKIDSLRMYNLLRRDAAGQLHLILLEGGELVAHPIDPAQEWSFKQDWPEDEWRSDQFSALIDRVGTLAVNDPLRLRNYTEGRGHSWLLREADGTAWWIDGDGIRHWLPDVASQEAISNNYLTLHPAQWQNDVCPYPESNSSGIRVC